MDTLDAKFFRIRTCKKPGEGGLSALLLAASQRKQRGRLRGVRCNGLKFGIAEAQRVGHLDLGGFEHADEF